MKLLFLAKPTSDQFAIPYLNYLGCDKIISKDYDHILSRVDDYDIIWCEWANDFTAKITETPLNPKVMVRVHDHEIYKGRIHNITWDNVDVIWFINRRAQEDFNKEIKVNCEQFVMANAVDPKMFQHNPVDNKEIGFLSIYMRPRKRLDRAIEVFKKVIEVDPEWKMTIRAEPWDEDSYHLMTETQDLNIEWDLRKINEETYGNDKNDVSSFFSQKSVVLSTSDHEGFHYALAEGALCGCMPVVYDWGWGYPKDFWGDFVHNSTDEMAQAILNYSKSDSYRQYILDNFGADKLSAQLKVFLAVLLTQLNHE